MDWIDISQALTKTIGHWPGDTPFSYQLSFTKEETGSVNIGKIKTSLHTGTHVDAPFHFDDQGKTIDQLALGDFIGIARIVDVSDGDRVTVDQLAGLEFGDFDQILFRTSLANRPERFPDRIPVLDEGLAPFLKERGIKLVGVDLPSVDQTDSKELRAHHAFHRAGIQILENIMLDHVADGLYELIALPLPLVGADGSPVRAVIRRLKGSE